MVTNTPNPPVSLTYPPSELRPHGATVWGFYIPLQPADPTITSSWITSRLMQYSYARLVNHRYRVMSLIQYGTIYQGYADPKEFHGLHGRDGVNALDRELDLNLADCPLFPIVNATPGTPIIGFVRIPLLQSTAPPYATWGIVVRNGTGCTVIDSGVDITTGTWYELSVIKNQTTGDLAFTIYDDTVTLLYTHVIPNTDANIPNLDDGTPILLGKCHAYTPAISGTGYTFPVLSFIDYDVSKFVPPTDNPVWTTGQTLKLAALLNEAGKGLKT